MALKSPAGRAFSLVPCIAPPLRLPRTSLCNTPYGFVARADTSSLVAGVCAPPGLIANPLSAFCLSVRHSPGQRGNIYALGCTYARTV